jgi:hypothetical protein
MNRQGHEDTNFFVGTEIEASPVNGHRTLFVVGLQTNEDIDWKRGEIDAKARNPITHIYFGANQSFPNPALTDAETWSKWERMIQHWLDRGYWCTLDLDSSAVEGLCEGGLCEQAQFIPMISVKLPYIKLLGYNATIKLDDKDFRATNPGVWCHSLHDLMDRKCFTSWDQYTKDEVVK